ncbi:tryptophan synthase subunit alpha [Thermogymnomonas acidicola]|uniref:tryptophan synthase subunit alpha n=1 Tax=Thermogymnomonas acidicola TaxID=399579 RepID=UPI000946144F|nr:tryptophan synthase subunit alpha [Thermogymnomonas acidicola]
MRKLILYLTFNYPSPDTFTRFLDEVSRLPVDYVELGLPTQNPVYDGPAIRQTHSGTRRPSAEEMSRAVKKLHGAGIRTYFLQYFRDIEGGQRDTFLTTVNASGADGILLPDLLIDFFQGAEGTYTLCTATALTSCPSSTRRCLTGRSRGSLP